ncbi:MAG: helicase-associated domain-containing protein, partial [Treponema sp.]|nr:helicase-associated domain-containing protein [Treponema sp.]
MKADREKALIVQSDRTLLLDVHCKTAEAARRAIIPFAELEKSPEHIHTYRITPLSLWNAASAGFNPQDVVCALIEHSRYEMPPGLAEGFRLLMARYGKIRMAPDEKEPEKKLALLIKDEAIRVEIGSHKMLLKYLEEKQGGFSLDFIHRGTVKRELIRLGWPVRDEAPLVSGGRCEINLRGTCLSGRHFTPRDYQIEAASAVVGQGGPGAGYGVVVLPCGSGKTIVGILIMSMLKTDT